jgi:hypothetical protein
MLSRPPDLPAGHDDGEQIYVTGHDVEYISSVIEQPRTPTVERHTTGRLRGGVRRPVSLQRSEQCVCHCWPTSWA